LPSIEERRRLTERIAASEGLKKAARLRQMFLFLAERSFRDPPESVKEQEIGIEVFAREPGYDPGEDNIVRNAARQLRVKLREYFEGEGAGESWLVDMPKGGYRLVCEPRKGVETPPAPSTWRSQQLALIVFLLALSVAVNLLQWLAPRAPATATAPSLATTLFPPASPAPRIVVGDFGLFLLSSLQNKRFPLNDYADRRYLNFLAPQPSPPFLQPFGELLSTRQIVSMGELNGAISLLQSLASSAQYPEIRHARTVTARDLRETSTILLGTENTNPWFKLFEHRVQMQFRQGGFQSLSNPSLRFGVEVSGARASGGRGYAHLTMLRLPSQAKVFMISGLNMSAVDAGAEFATRPQGLEELFGKLAVKPGQLSEFEAIVETQSADFTPTRYRVVWASLLSAPVGLRN
jgi:hypothetical protein